MSPGDLLAQWLQPFPYFRGRYRLLNALVPRTGLRHARVFGYDMELDLGELVSRWVYMGVYEIKERRWIEEYLRPGMTVVDSGANIGYFTAMFSQLSRPTGRVFSFEPSPFLFSRLQALIEANAIRQTRAFNLGLSDTNGELTLYVPPASAGNYDPSMVRYTEHMTETRVPVRTLDSLATDLGWNTIDLLKLDIEGHEPQALRGANELLAARRIRAILCEFNDPLLRQAGSSAQVLYQSLLEHGFYDPLGTPPTQPIFTRLLRRQG